MSWNDTVRRLALERGGRFSTREMAQILAARFPGYDSTYYRSKAYCALKEMEDDGLVRSELAATYRAPSHRIWEVIA